MKKQLSYSVLSLVFVIFFTSVNAQSGNAEIVKVSPTTEITAINVGETFKDETVNPSSAFESNFEQAFPGAKEVKWSKIENGLIVTCIVTGQKVSAAYNNNGKMNYSITNLIESNIPGILKSVINNDYSGFIVIKAIRINNGGNITNQVILKSDKKFVTLKSNGEDVDVESIDNASAAK